MRCIWIRETGVNPVQTRCCELQSAARFYDHCPAGREGRAKEQQVRRPAGYACRAVGCSRGLEQGNE